MIKLGSLIEMERVNSSARQRVLKPPADKICGSVRFVRSIERLYVAFLAASWLE